jgi:hypothetical protein
MTKQTLPSPRDILGPDGIHAIGLFIVTWNQMETLMTLDVSVLFRLSLPEAAAVMGGFSIEQKIATLAEALKRALLLPTLPEAKEWQDLPSKIRALNNTRTHVAHGQWLIAESGKATAAKNLMAAKWMGVEEVKSQQADLDKIVTTLSLIFWKLNEIASTHKSMTQPAAQPI